MRPIILASTFVAAVLAAPIGWTPSPAQAASVTIRTGDPEMRAVTRKRVIIRGDRGRHLGWERGRHRGWDDGGRRVVHKTIIRRGDGSRTVIRRSTED